MGTSWSVIYAADESGQVGDLGPVSPQDLQLLIERELEAINQSLSTYIPDSEISIVNALRTEAPVQLSQRFAEVLDAALLVGQLTEGAYDVTVGPLIELWGFGATLRAASPPEAVEISAAMDLVGSDRLSWDSNSAILSRPPGVRIDLSSIAKGYAVDQLTEVLTERGITNSLVEIGGELRASGQRPEGGPWRLAVESPDPAQARFIEALSISNAAVATSGDYRNYFEYQGRRYSHLVDPRSGYPVAHDLVSVTVIDPLCIKADALATALLVLGLEKAMQLAEEAGLAAHFVARGNEALEVHYTTAFDTYRQSAQAAHTP
ncbi:FAD:protein FMN transferase [Congregibacter variabilis]|uniref:FAD:protein FMN transferase n=1 Tax=Congregibacter variabilis TaxID=3081200 RepID=A0ABZ0I5X2_9GAMM|nr:FAD:protein FMN transferase [Congregibacter sp. IMCC43200]